MFGLFEWLLSRCQGTRWASEQAVLALTPQASMAKIYQLKMLETVPYIYG